MIAVDLERAANGRQHDKSRWRQMTRRGEDAVRVYDVERAVYSRQCDKSGWWWMTRRADGNINVD